MDFGLTFVFILLVNLLPSETGVLEKHPNQIENLRNAPSINIDCTSGEVKAWSITHHCGN